MENYFELLNNSTNDSVRFNIIFINNSRFSTDTLSNYVLSWNLLAPGGVLIVKNTIGLDKFVSCLNEGQIVDSRDDLVIVRK